MEVNETQFDAVSLGILWNRLVSITDEIETLVFYGIDWFQ